MSRDFQRDLQIANQLQDPFIRRTLKTALHLRRYFPFYVVTLVFLVALATFPSVQGGGDDDGTADLAAGGTQGGTDTASAPTGDASVSGPVDVGTGVAAQQPGARVARPAPVAAKNVQESLAAASQATGKTKGGVDCRPGVRQIPISRYAAHCTAAFTGNNGGATSFGVLPDKIVVVRRSFPDTANSRAVEAVVRQAGGAGQDDIEKRRDVFIPYFEKMMELYGRKVEWVDYLSRYGDSTDEQLSKGREGACADATEIKNQHKAFAVFPGRNTAQTLSAVFAECAAERGMITLAAAPYYPETWYRKHHPYAWGGVMECERISYQVAEYLSKRLARKKAKWAGDAVMRNTNRKFGTYVPDNDAYQSCVTITKREVEQKYGYKEKQEQYNYALDVSRFPEQAAQAIVQFKAAGVTTIVLACDPISAIFLTQAAARQQYFPEWVQIGTALNDVDNAARLFDQSAVEGRLFGPSQLGATKKLFGKESEPYILYKQLTGQELTADGATDGNYWSLLGLYSGLQRAGPLLSPTTWAEGVFRAPPGGDPDYAIGYISYQDAPDGTPGGRDHTGIDDSREIYWMRNQRSEADGHNGTYVETYGGKRFKNGQWPAEDPPIYPGR